ncbi:MAG: DUF4189 domain-containing protein [Rhizobiaceae bacterium]
MRRYLCAVGMMLAFGGLAQAQGAIDQPFECPGEGVTYHVGYEDGDLDWVFVSAEFSGTRADEQLEFALRAEPAGSGFRFARDFAEFRGRGDEAFLEIDGQRIACVASSPSMPALGHDAGAIGIHGQSLGGNLRAGPGTQYERLDSLAEETLLMIDGNAGVAFDGYDWFEVSYGGRRGYKWGGILCSEGEHVNGLYSQCPTLMSVDAGQPGEPWWMAFAIDGQGGVGHGAASTEVQASLFAEQHCDNPNCNVVDTTQAQCHALAHFLEGEAYYYGVATGESLDATSEAAMAQCDSASLGGDCELSYSYCH